LSSAIRTSPVIIRCAASATKGSAAEFRISNRSSIASCTVSQSKEERSMFMAFCIDSAFLHDIMNVLETVPVAGVTTNPTILLSARERGQKLSPHQLLRELLRELTGSIFMQPGDVEEENMYSQAMSYLEIDSSRGILKIPMNE